MSDAGYRGSGARRPRAFSQTVTATVAANGTALVTFTGPLPWWVRDVDAIALSSTSSAIPKATLYRSGVPSRANVLGTCRDGIAGSFDRTGQSDRMASADLWTVQWTGATVGAVCSATMSGTDRPA